MPHRCLTLWHSPLAHPLFSLSPCAGHRQGAEPGLQVCDGGCALCLRAAQPAGKRCRLLGCTPVPWVKARSKLLLLVVRCFGSPLSRLAAPLCWAAEARHATFCKPSTQAVAGRALAQDARNQTGFVLEQLQQQAVDLGQAVSAELTEAQCCRTPTTGCLHASPPMLNRCTAMHARGRGRAITCRACSLSLQAAAMPMRVQKIESTMALLETGDLKLRVRCALFDCLVVHWAICCSAVGG